MKEPLRLKKIEMTLKKFNYFLAVLATVMFTGAYAQQTAKITSSGIGYLEYLPQGYNTNTNNYPVVISLHGIGEKGTTSTDPAIIKESAWKAANVSLAKYIKYGQQYPFIVISPQLKSSYGTWPANYVLDVINHVKKTLRIDSRRVYLTGLSLGGFGVWTTAATYPEVFAAIAPICSGGNALTKACNIASENIPTWAFHGDADTRVSYQVSLKMVNAINACAIKPNPLAKITIYPGLGHGIWDKVYKESGVLNWMLTFTNGTTSTSTTTPTNTAPVVSAGADKAITLPTNSSYFQSTASDADGIASYQWTKIYGGTATLSGATSSKLTVSNLVAGTYTFRVTVKDTKGASKYDDVKLTVASSTTNTAPVVSAGPDKTITLPTNSSYFQGSASDADGIASWQWAKTYGGSVTLTGATSPKLTVSNLAAGTYTFRLTVKDKKGASKSDYVKITVLSSTSASASTSTSTSTTNIVDKVYAGTDKTLYLPSNWTYLSSSVSDSDGIASYQWTKVSGGTTRMDYANTYRVKVSSLVAGTYTFRLTVKDNTGAVRSDDVRVIVRS